MAGLDDITPQTLVDWWNNTVPVGTRVRYWLVDQREPKVTTTRSAAEVLGGHTAVVWLEGVTGAWALSHVSAHFPEDSEIGGAS